jgi:hypothetical protein
MVCAKRGDFGQFPFPLTSGFQHYLLTTGGIPANWRSAVKSRGRVNHFNPQHDLVPHTLCIDVR